MMSRLETLMAYLGCLSPLILAAALVFTWRGLALARRTIATLDDDARPILLLRSGRALIVAVALVCLAAGGLARSDGVVVFGLVFLGEELYETGVALLIVRHGRHGAAPLTGGLRPVAALASAPAARHPGRNG
jgi:hypothetical protein